MSSKYSRYLTAEAQNAVVLPFPVSRSRRIECSYDFEADIYSDDSRFSAGLWLTVTLATLAFCVWAAFQLI